MILMEIWLMNRLFHEFQIDLNHFKWKHVKTRKSNGNLRKMFIFFRFWNWQKNCLWFLLNKLSQLNIIDHSICRFFSTKKKRRKTIAHQIVSVRLSTKQFRQHEYEIWMAANVFVACLLRGWCNWMHPMISRCERFMCECTSQHRERERRRAFTVIYIM